MNQSPSKAAAALAGAARPAARGDEIGGMDDRLLRPSIFGGNAPDISPPPPAAPAAHPESAPALKLFVKGLKPGERQLLEGLVKVSQRRTPRLELLDDAQARLADVVMIDTRDASAMSWARRHPWLARRAVIWVDGADAAAGHTALRRPVQWPILPMVLARALECGPGTIAAAISTPATLAAESAIREPARAPQILVVDDSLAVRAHLRSLLERLGYLVTDADSVEVALDSLDKRDFDCVLMDVLMPEVDGYEGCHQVKARRRGPRAVPVVMLTSKSSPFDRIRGKMAGCDAYLTKPVDPSHLAEVLAQHVRAAPVRRAAAALEPAVVPPVMFATTRPA